MTIQYQAKLIRPPVNLKSGNWQETAYQWQIIINGQTFDYYTGSALVNKNGTPKKPVLDDILYSLTSDDFAFNMPFNDWCEEFGYSSDSIAAQNIYFACQDNAKKLRETGIDIEAERLRLQDY